MEQDNERDYLGRQYAPGQYGPPASAGEESAGEAGTSRPQQQPAAPPAAAAGQTPDAAPIDGPARGVQVGTVVWGLVLTVLAVLLLLMNTVNLSVDPVLLALGVTLGAGLALLAGGFLSGMQRGRSR